MEKIEKRSHFGLGIQCPVSFVYLCCLNNLVNYLADLPLQVNNAYSVLSSASQRHEYDLRLRDTPVTRPPGGSPFGPVPPHR